LEMSVAKTTLFETHHEPLLLIASFSAKGVRKPVSKSTSQ
jgi:hypothetical protein